MYILKIAALLTFLVGCTWYGIHQLRQKQSSAVQIVFYFFSLACVATLLVAAWAISNGTIDPSGEPHGVWGERIMKFLALMLDLEFDIQLMGAIGVLLFAPQLLSYLLSAAFGCATRLQLVESGISFIVWSVVKSFAIASGILAAIGLVGSWYVSSSPNGFPILQPVVLALWLMFYSFLFLYWYYEAHLAISRIEDRIPVGFRNKLANCHKWATRHRSAKGD